MSAECAFTVIVDVNGDVWCYNPADPYSIPDVCYEFLPGQYGHVWTGRLCEPPVPLPTEPDPAVIEPDPAPAPDPVVGQPVVPTAVNAGDGNTGNADLSIGLVPGLFVVAIVALIWRKMLR